MNAAGAFVVAWDSTYPDTGQAIGYAHEAWARWYAADGTPGNDIRVDASRGGGPSVGIAGDGDFLVVWDALYTGTSSQHLPFEGSNGLRARGFSAGGTPQGSEVAVNGPIYAMNADGIGLIRYGGGGPNGLGITVQRISVAAEILGSAVDVEGSEDGYYPYGGHVGIDSDGNFAVVWTGFDYPPAQRLARGIPPALRRRHDAARGRYPGERLHER
jgi:hypothetical protein